MTTTAIRKKIHEYTDDADATKLKVIYSLLQKIDEKGTTVFKKYSLEGYNESLNKAEEEIARGKYLIQKVAVKEMKKWELESNYNSKL